MAFCLIKYAKNIWKFDKVLSIHIETIYKTRTRGKLSIRALLFFYLTIGSCKFFKHSEGFHQPLKNCLLKPLWKQQKFRSFTGLNAFPLFRPQINLSRQWQWQENRGDSKHRVQSIRRSEDACFAEDHFKCYKYMQRWLMQQAMNSVRLWIQYVRAHQSQVALHGMQTLLTHWGGGRLI